MTAARTKEHEEQKHTGIWKEKIRKVGSKEQKQENLTEGTHSNKYSRLCYKAEPGTFSHYLSSSWSRRQRYQVSIKKSHTQLLRINWNETTVQIDIFARMFANTPEYVNFVKH